MKNSFAEELYSESLKVSNLDLNSSPSIPNIQVSIPQDSGLDDSFDDGEPFGDCSDDELGKMSDLDREWQLRHKQFHTMGYRDGIIAGKEASAQEGYNSGYKKSFSAGYNWGVVRGVTSALASLPDDLKEKMLETEDKRTEFRKLHDSTRSLSSTEALTLFNDSIAAKRISEQDDHSDAILSNKGDLSDKSLMESYGGELQSLLESSEIKVNFFRG